VFPISRDPPEGGTAHTQWPNQGWATFPISRDPPEGGTFNEFEGVDAFSSVSNF